ncbi:unnamed protein product [Cylicocyclus nassatus]|uniref:Uncharacterized protein n=1 Tax=Cylicocyclus nassatus TaxID=53992 RepID=A0AA36H8S3_CYLNA|nr:unnamed protein product [Cylicocyclus nassatus]
MVPQNAKAESDEDINGAVVTTRARASAEYSRDEQIVQGFYFEGTSRLSAQMFKKWRLFGVIVIGDVQARRARLSLAPSTSSEPAALLSTLSQAAADEEVGPSQIVAEETADLSDVAPNETVALGEGGVRNVVELDYRDKLLFFACYTVLHGTSTAELRRLMMLIEVATGKAANIGVADIRKFVDNLESDLRSRSYTFCSSCFQTLVNKHALCDNSRCELYRIHPKRSKSSRRPSLSLLDIRPQLETVIATHLSLLINLHRRLHESHFDCGTRSDAIDFPLFKKNMESSEEFSRRRITLQLSIATDGFTPARLSRQELWPLYVRIDDLPSKIGNMYLNIILAGVLWTTKTPHEELWEGLWTHMVTELAVVNCNELLQIRDVTGDLWTVSLRLTHAVVDYKGLQDIFGIPRWFSRYGCHKCLFPGNCIGRKLNWYCSEPLRFAKRTSANILEDAECGRNGLRGKTSAMRLFTPAHCCADALHVISEGVTHDRLRDLLFRASKVDEMKLKSETVGELNRALMNITNYTYSSRFILCNEDLPCMTGAEVDAFANVVFPLVGALAMCPSALSSASLVGYWFCVKELQALEDLTTVKIRVIQSVALHVKQIWSCLSQDIFTIKTHNFFDHCIVDEIEQHGSPYLWSAAPFEAIHRVLQIPHNQFVTNSDARILTRFVTIKKLVRLLERAVEKNRSENFAKLLRDMQNEEERFPLQVQLGAGYYIPQHSEVREDNLCEEHRAIFQRHHRGLRDVKIYSRLVVSGKVLSSKVYWQRTTDTDASSLYLRVSCGNNMDKVYMLTFLFTVFLRISRGEEEQQTLMAYKKAKSLKRVQSQVKMKTVKMKTKRGATPKREESPLFMCEPKKEVLDDVEEIEIEKPRSDSSDSSELGLERVYATLEPVQALHTSTVHSPDVTEHGSAQQIGWSSSSEPGTSQQVPWSNEPGIERAPVGSAPPSQQPTLQSDALDVMRTCLSREIGSTEFSTPLYAMVARGTPLSSVTLQETLHHCRQVTQFDLQDLSRLVQSAERSRHGISLFDNIETTRLLVENAISNRVLVNLLLTKNRDLESQIHVLRQICNKLTSGISESSSTISFSPDNLKKQHIIKRSSPFKELNLNELLAGYTAPSRVKHKTSLVINDFSRVIFRQVCGPDPSDIWNFAHRTSNVSRKPDLQDLPESIVITLNDFVLDALSLGNEDLEGYRLNSIRSLRTSYWISLGTSDEEREKKFNYLLEQKTFYCGQIRTCIAEALNNMLYKLLLFALLVSVYGGGPNQPKRFDVAPSSDAGPLSIGSNGPRPRPQLRPQPHSGRGHVHPGPQCPIRNPSYEAWYSKFKRRGWDFSSDQGDILLEKVRSLP